MKNIIFRTCMGCNQKKDKNELVRIVANKQGEVKVEKNEKFEGRGAYICLKTECLNRVIKTKRLERALRTRVDEKIYEYLRGVIIDKQNENQNS